MMNWKADLTAAPVVRQGGCGILEATGMYRSYMPKRDEAAAIINLAAAAPDMEDALKLIIRGIGTEMPRHLFLAAVKAVQKANGE